MNRNVYSTKEKSSLSYQAVKLIHKLYDHWPEVTEVQKQTFLYYNVKEIEPYKELKRLQDRKHWDIIIQCPPSKCPLNDWFPIGRIIPSLGKIPSLEKS